MTAAPGWLRAIPRRVREAEEGNPAWARFAPTGLPGQRASAVLILFGDTTGDPGNPTLLLTERAHTMRSHPGQVSFPGGRAEPRDPDLVTTALREANEEVGLTPGSVDVQGLLPAVNLSVSSHDVTPVLGWWTAPAPLWVREPREVHRVLQTPVADLVDPANRFRVGHPSGWVGPAFQAQDLVVWGFTAMLLDGVLRLGGLEQPWDESDVRPFPQQP